MLTLKVLAGLIQLHGPGATVQSDHQGIDALLNNMRDEQSSEKDATAVKPTEVYFRRGGFVRGPYGGGAFRRGYAPGFRRGGFLRGY